MKLTEKQSKGLDIAIRRFRELKPYTVIAGYAGTGKSTLINFIVSALIDEGVDPDRIVFAAYTGKAVRVLQEKGNSNAQTLHKLIYTARPTPSGGFILKPKTNINADVVIVDECSMAPRGMVELLLSYHKYVIFCGDPGQLPPIKKNENNGLLDNPDIFLDEIMRQAQESEIIRLSMAIREGKSLKPYKGKEVQIIKRSELSLGMLKWADQVLCATNATRIGLNNKIRESLGFSPDFIEDGDRMICLHNYTSDFNAIISEEGNFLVNGTTGIWYNPYPEQLRLPYGYSLNKWPITNGEFVGDGEDHYGSLSTDTKLVLTGNPSLPPQEQYRLSKNRRYTYIMPCEFAFGYAITVWKAQGSEYDKILLLEERHPYNPAEHRQYMYTGITRAREKAVIVIGD